uniref:Uncharacterized protein n=1 Tax=Lepeophtheirus salmonis TaxID=72036 RepID=A0A0K2V6Z8_LEPSM
MYGRISKGIH